VLRKQKGQGMTEFALILPLLLLLLLGVIEAGRVIWAYITVQNAAREATRYAVTGRPYLDSNSAISSQLQVCLGSEEELDPISSGGIQPWLCAPEDRVEAIKQVALSHGNTLAVSQECDDPPEYFGDCAQQPGAFGVLIQGQVTTETVTGTLIVAPDPVQNHPGQQGLNIQVSTFYNLQMITPIFDAIMGGTFVRLEGRVQLQNEGLDAASGIEPPPGINPPPTPESGDSGGDFVSNAKIWSVSGYTNIQQSDTLIVHLDKHDNGPHYNVYLDDGDASNPDSPYLICENKATGPDDNADVSCPLDVVGVPPGLYTLYSAEYPASSPSVAVDVQELQIVAGGDEKIVVDGGNIWAANEITQLTLLFHLGAEGPFDVKLYDKDDTFVQDIAVNHSGSSGDKIDWTVPDIGANCDLSSGATCTIKSFKDNGDLAAEQAVNVNDPQVILTGDVGPYARGETVYIFLKAHTPGRRYSIRIPGPTSTMVYDTLDTNAAGDTTNPVAWIIPADCGGPSGWPNGFYDVESYPLGQTSPQIAIKEDVILDTPPDPFITVEGGYTWSAGSFINIKIHQHDAPNETYYLKFDGDTVGTVTTNECGEATIGYAIAEDKPEGDYPITSHKTESGPVVASRDVTVTTDPLIKVVEGDIVLPDEVITIQLSNHPPFASFNIIYANKVLGSLLTDDQGKAELIYDITTLPITPEPDFSDPNNYGVPYEMRSETVSDPVTVAATTDLTIQAADLVVTKVVIPSSVPPPDSTVPVDIVVRNAQSVPISCWVDIDVYLNPEPVVPSHLAGYNFPGDIKYWRDSIGPNETFTITHNIDVTEYGLQSVYGFADTSNYVFEGEISNPNNIGNSPFVVDCDGGVFADTFSTDYAQGDAIPNWAVRTYGNGGNQGYQTQVTGDELYLNNSGSSTWQSNDNNGGQIFVYRDETLPSASGLDVQVMLNFVSLIGSWSKAGLEIRDSLDANSPRVVWGVARENWASNQVMQPGYRDGGGMNWVDGDSVWRNNHEVSLSSGPVWLRITRDAGGNGDFNFYYRQPGVDGGDPGSPPAPDAPDQSWWGSVRATQGVSGIGDEVYVGLFHSPYQSNQAGTARIDEFRAFPDPSGCPGSQTDEPFPPGLKVCTDLLLDQSFEDLFSSPWGWNDPSGLNLHSSDGANSGNFSARASTFDGAFYNPAFHQRFTMPDWVLSTTTELNFDFYRNTDVLADGAEPDDKFYAVVATSPSEADALTDPVEVANGNGSQGVNPADWTKQSIQLPVKTGVNLEDYIGEQLYIYLYNNSNSSGPCGGTCATRFYFDDASLTSCTTQPKPSPINTRITGKLILNFSDGTSGALPFVKVWAYAQDDPTVYETFTIQGGEFNFYNLPATASGKKYTIFAQYHLTQGSQIETLAADTSVILKNSNGDGNPAQVFLNLYSLSSSP